MKKKPASKKKKPSQEDAPKATPQPGDPKAAIEIDGWVGHSFSTPDRDIHVLMPKDITKHHGNPADPTQRSYAAIRQQFQTDLNWLIKRACRGEWDAIKLLAEIGIDAAAALGNLHRLSVDKVKRVARTFQEWPMVISPEPDHPQNAKRLRKELELGSEIAARQDKVLHKKKPLLQREVVFHTLSMFLGFRKHVASVHRANVLNDVLAATSKANASHEDLDQTAAEVYSVHLSILNGEIRKAQQMATAYQEGLRSHRRKLQTILALPATTSAEPNLAIAQNLMDSCRLQVPSMSSIEDWLDLILKFLVVLIGNQPEENDVLRKLGDSRGDVEIRNLLKTNDPTELKKRKPEFRYNATVNDAIRRRIKEKLEDALKALVTGGK